MSAYPAYNYDSVAYDYGYAGASPQRLRNQERDFEVMQGGGRRVQQELSPNASIALSLAKVIVVAMVVFAFVGIIRVSLSAATVAEAIEANEVANLIEQARSESNQLEVSSSTLSNPTRIRTEAADLGMAAPATTSFIDLSGDVVVTNAKGQLSLAGSVGVLESAAPAAIAG